MPYADAARKPKDDAAESELLEALKAEEEAAQSSQSELISAQTDAWQRYMGDAYGDEVEGNSQVTTRELYETVQWLRPDLKRTFLAGGKVFEFEGVTAEADQYADQASELCNYNFLVDNDGETELDAYIFDGLVHRIGILGCEWREAQYSPEQEVTGINTMQMQKLLADPTTQIMAQDAYPCPPDEAHPDGICYDLKIKRRTADAYPESFAIAPEDFRVAPRTTMRDFVLSLSRYQGDVVRMSRGEAKKKWPGFDEEIDAATEDTTGFENDERRAERFRDDDGAVGARLQYQGEASTVAILREYIRHDFDGDGIAEMRRCYRVNDTLLEHEEVDEHIYSIWSPNPIPHRLIGMSTADETKDIQRVKTVLLRKMLDSVNHAVAPRTYANTKMISQRGLDALLTVRPGVIIEGEGNASEAIQPIITPDLSASALNAMQWVDRISESRTGVTRSAQPMDPDMIHDTAKGEQLLQNAASIRKEEIARNLARGLRNHGEKLFRLNHKHQNESRSIKVAGGWRNIDPRAWEARMRCTVSVGLGTGAKDQHLAMIQVLQGDQVAWVQAYGPGQPYGPGPNQMYALARKKYDVIGIKNADQFLGPEPPPGWAPQTPPSPEQQKLQLKVQEQQMDMQRQQFDNFMKAQDAQRQQAMATLTAGLKQWMAEQDVARKDLEMAMAQDRSERQSQFEARQAVLQQAFEERMAIRQQLFEERLAQRQAEHDQSVERAKIKTTGSDPNFGGKPG